MSPVVMFVVVLSTYGTQTSQIEMQSMAACEAAAPVVESMHPQSTRTYPPVYALCINRGETGKP